MLQDSGDVLEGAKRSEATFVRPLNGLVKGMGCLHGGLNTGPTAYKAGALPLSYEGWEPSL